MKNMGFVNIFDDTYNISNVELTNNFYNEYNKNELFKTSIYKIKKVNLNTISIISCFLFCITLFSFDLGTAKINLSLLYF